MRDVDLFGGVEAGGTKFVCAIGSGHGELLARKEFETTLPAETLGKVCDFFKGYPGLKAIGVGSFGPLDLKVGSKSYGAIRATTKHNWSGVNIQKHLKEASGLPVRIATDTDVSAIGEGFFGKATKSINFVYLTVGTGIGGSVVADDRLLHGINQLEIGHIRVPHNTVLDPFKGACEFHGDCLEGLASGQALHARSGIKAEELKDQKVWELEASYLAYGLVSIILIVQPEIIILGGSVMKHPGLIDLVRLRVKGYINGYLDLPEIIHTSSDSIGVLGAIKLATQ